MTGRTHDLAAFTSLTIVFLAFPLQEMTLATAITAFGANFIGGLFPDIDQPTSDLWDNFRGGEFLSRYVCKFLGGHRHLSHSLVGTILIAIILDRVLEAAAHIVLVDMTIIWWSFMIGVVSHIAFDMPTKAGVPLFWPIMTSIGLPPIRSLRMTSGKFIESMIVFPGLLFLNIYLFYMHQDKILDFFRNYIK